MVEALGRKDLDSAAELFLTMWVDGPYRKPGDIHPEVRERVREMVTRSFGLSRLAPNVRGIDPPAIGRLSAVSAPTLIVLGDKDAPDILAIGRLIHRGVAGSQLVTLTDVGHSLPMERPMEFSRIVDGFLQ